MHARPAARDSRGMIMSNNINRRRFLTRAGLVVGGVVAGPSLLCRVRRRHGRRRATDTFKVGAVLELSGASATGGQIAQRGYQLWADTVNSKGGLSIGDKKYNVELVVQDCKSDPATGADATSRLVTEEGVNAIFGAYTSGVQLAMDPICAKYRVPCIAGSAESPGVWKKQPAFTFGVIPAVDTTAARSIQSIVDTANPKPVHGGGRRRQRAVLRRHRRGLPRGCRGREARSSALLAVPAERRPGAGRPSGRGAAARHRGGRRPRRPAGRLREGDGRDRLHAEGDHRALRDHRCLLRAGARPPSRRRDGDLGVVADRVFQGRPVRLGRRLREGIRGQERLATGLHRRRVQCRGAGAAGRGREAG